MTHSRADANDPRLLLFGVSADGKSAFFFDVGFNLLKRETPFCPSEAQTTPTCAHTDSVHTWPGCGHAHAHSDPGNPETLPCTCSSYLFYCRTATVSSDESLGLSVFFVEFCDVTEQEAVTGVARVAMAPRQRVAFRGG